MAELTGEAWHAEQRRRSQDMIRVFNPTNEDYVLLWDEGGASARFVIPSRYKDLGWGPGMRVLQRYLARKYTKEIVDKIILSKQDEKLNQLKSKLESQGAADIEYNANMQLMSTTGLRSDSAKVRQPLEDQVWLGMEEEFGVEADSIPIEEKKPVFDEDPFERLKDKKYVAAPKVVLPVEQEPPPEEPKEKEEPKVKAAPKKKPSWVPDGANYSVSIVDEETKLTKEAIKNL